MIYDQDNDQNSLHRSDKKGYKFRSDDRFALCSYLV